MNNEIKEMLEQMGSIAITGKSKNGVRVDGYGLQQNELKIFLEYLTNLQQRIEGLEAENETLRSDFKNQVEYTNKIAEENERLKNGCKKLEQQVDDLYELETTLTNENERLKVNCNLGYEELKVARDYKSRCEKASEKIKKIRENAIKYGADHDAIVCDDLLNILQNGDDKDD